MKHHSPVTIHDLAADVTFCRELSKLVKYDNLTEWIELKDFKDVWYYSLEYIPHFPISQTIPAYTISELWYMIREKLTTEVINISNKDKSFIDKTGAKWYIEASLANFLAEVLLRMLKGESYEELE